LFWPLEVAPLYQPEVVAGITIVAACTARPAIKRPNNKIPQNPNDSVFETSVIEHPLPGEERAF
jgi:hypothetical protein